MIDWASLSHAYGEASDVPEMLARLRSGDAAEAAHELWGAVLHQGTLYDATPPAVAEICRVLASRAVARIEPAGWLLAAAVHAANAYPPDDPLAVAVLEAAPACLGVGTRCVMSQPSEPAGCPNTRASTCYAWSAEVTTRRSGSAAP